MTKEEARQSLFNTKMYVNGKSEEIQQKLFELGFTWGTSSDTIRAIDKPYLFTNTSLIGWNDSMDFFKNSTNHEVSADYILNLEWDEESIFESKIKELEEELSKTQYKRYSEGITIIIPTNESADEYCHAIEKSIKQIAGKPKTTSDLKPFDRVLGRDTNDKEWTPDIFREYLSENKYSYPYQCIGGSYEQCIPYEGNEDKLK